MSAHHSFDESFDDIRTPSEHFSRRRHGTHDVEREQGRQIDHLFQLAALNELAHHSPLRTIMVIKEKIASAVLDGGNFFADAFVIDQNYVHVAIRIEAKLLKNQPHGSLTGA